ncbi:MAG: hypothetical protein GC179_21520 [Anaerolineaceae bacterium]|nr:hypothetical protein [Anaerolineaceae bacterium]
MTSEFFTQLTDLIERWDILSKAAAERLEKAEKDTQGDFYAGLLFGIDIASDELAAALAKAVKESTQMSSGLLKSPEKPLN